VGEEIKLKMTGRERQEKGVRMILKEVKMKMNARDNEVRRATRIKYEGSLRGGKETEREVR
jgi:hypothetical protein